MQGNKPLQFRLPTVTISHPTAEAEPEDSPTSAVASPRRGLGFVPLLSAGDEARIGRRIEVARLQMRAATFGSPLAVAALWTLVQRAEDDSSVPALYAREVADGATSRADLLGALERRKGRHWAILRRLDRARAEEEREILLQALGLAQERQREAFDAPGLSDAGFQKLCAELIRVTDRWHSTAAGRALGEEIHGAHRRLVTAQSRYRAALTELVSANLGLVISLATRYRGRGLMLPDLIQEGNIGCLRAAEKFDYRRGCKFSTYAVWWIRQALRRALSNQSRTIRLPVHVAERRSQVLRIASSLELELGRRPTEDELARATGLTTDALQRLLDGAAEPLSLERPVGTEGRMRLGDLVRDAGGADPQEASERKAVGDRVRKLVHVLSGREAEVISMHYGLDRQRELTLDEIGAVLGVSRERVRQIEVKALDKLRRAVGERALRELL